MSARLMDPRRADGSFPFTYRNSASTDIRATFERVRREQQANAAPQVSPKTQVEGSGATSPPSAVAAPNVRTIQRKKV